MPLSDQTPPPECPIPATCKVRLNSIAAQRWRVLFACMFLFMALMLVLSTIGINSQSSLWGEHIKYVYTRDAEWKVLLDRMDKQADEHIKYVYARDAKWQVTIDRLSKVMDDIAPPPSAEDLKKKTPLPPR